MYCNRKRNTDPKTSGIKRAESGAVLLYLEGKTSHLYIPLLVEASSRLRQRFRRSLRLCLSTSPKAYMLFLNPENMR
jgi:hypothetical protein